MLYKILLTIHTLFEIAVGIIILAAPTLILTDLGQFTEPQKLVELTYSILRSFGVAAISIGMLSAYVIMRPLNSSVYYISAGTLTIFHLGMTIVQFINNMNGLVGLPIVVVHGVFAILFLGIFIWQLGSKAQAEAPKTA